MTHQRHPHRTGHLRALLAALLIALATWGAGAAGWPAGRTALGVAIAVYAGWLLLRQHRRRAPAAASA